MWMFKLAPNYTGAANSTGCVYWIYYERVLELMTLKSLILWFAFNSLNTHDLTVAKIWANSDQVDFEQHMIFLQLSIKIWIHLKVKHLLSCSLHSALLAGLDVRGNIYFALLAWWGRWQQLLGACFNKPISLQSLRLTDLRIHFHSDSITRESVNHCPACMHGTSWWLLEINSPELLTKGNIYIS